MSKENNSPLLSRLLIRRVIPVLILLPLLTYFLTGSLLLTSVSLLTTPLLAVVSFHRPSLLFLSVTAQISLFFLLSRTKWFSAVTTADTVSRAGSFKHGPDSRIPLKTISVILPCANEGEFAVRTVKSFFEVTPTETLLEVVVVDDGSTPPLESGHFDESYFKSSEISGRLVFVRHESHTGLINAKSAGGAVAKGDVFAFFDCHVRPRENWELEILKLLNEKPERIVVPSITSVDPSTWEEIDKPAPSGEGLAKCYLTLDADFHWFNDETSPEIPVISGGLLATSALWWNATQGYDRSMQGWGGENLDQSLRSWLCGGDIVHAQNSYVAHMWRVNHRPETKAKYVVPPGSVTTNRLKVVRGWFDAWNQKISDFPDFAKSKDLVIDSSNIETLRRTRQCKPFKYFLNHFKHIYVDAGLLPSHVFRIKDAQSGLCLVNRPLEKFQGELLAARCSDHDVRQLWHLANRKQQNRTCCSGLRNWNHNLCAARTGKSHECDISGRSVDQNMQIDLYGRLLGAGDMCLVPGRVPNERIHISTDPGRCMQSFQAFVVDKDYMQIVSDGRCIHVVDKDIDFARCDVKDASQMFRRGLAGVVKSKGGDCLVISGSVLKATSQCDPRVPEQNFRLPENKPGPLGLASGACIANDAVEATNFAVSLRGCVAEAGVIKPGQGLTIRMSAGEDFTIQEGEFCLKAISESAVAVARCPSNITAEFLWRKYGEHKLETAAFKNRCIDANDHKTAILYVCYSEENTNQEWETLLPQESLIRNTRSALCLDFKPEDDVRILSGRCDSFNDRNVRWTTEKHFEPLETKLYREADSDVHV